MSRPFADTSRGVLWGLPLLLAAFCLLGPRPAMPDDVSVSRLSLPEVLNSRYALPVSLNEHEQGVLEGSSWISRGYWRAVPDEADIIWVNMTQSRDISRLHNFYDSLVASGGEPRMLGDVKIPTPEGDILATHIRYVDTEGNPSHMLFWYRSGNASAANRWGWYAALLKQRLQPGTQGNAPWRLVEVAARELAETSGTQQSELQALIDFARQVETNVQSGDS